MRYFIQSLENALAENKARQSQIREELDSSQVDIVATKVAQNPVIARNPVTVFYAPYFKDVNLYTHPPNVDTKKRRANNELDLYLTNPRELNETEKTSIVDAVREQAIEKRLKALIEEEKEVLKSMRQAGISQLEKMELRTRLRKCIAQETDIRGLSDAVLFSNPSEEYDWLKIAAQAFNRSVSAQTCRLMWLNQLHPTINRGRWTREEDKRIKELINEPDEDGLLRPRKDWDKIATRLGTNRTAFLCFHRFQMKHNQAHSHRKWTPEEDARLRQLVVNCRLNRFVPWTKVAYYMEHRTKDQCYQRYVYSISDQIRMGFFEENEDHIILVGSKLFGHDWARIADFIPTRTPMQIHSRYNTFLKANFENWTQDEDIKLLATVKDKGEKDWVAIANEFKYRTRSQCRQRFYYIHKWYKRSSNFSLASLPYSDNETKQKTKQQELYRKLNQKVEEFLGSHKIQDPQLDEEEMDDTVIAKFHVEKEYHTTPDGEKIPMKALQNFMFELATDLPPAQRDLKPLAKPKVETLRSKALDPLGNLVPKGRPRIAPTVAPFQQKSNKKLIKLFESAWPIRIIRQKEVYRTEKELSTARSAGRAYLKLLSAEHLLTKGPGIDVPLHAVLRGKNECKENVVFERQKQFTLAVRAKVNQEPAAVIPKPRQAIMRTYSRKSRQTPYFKPARPKSPEASSTVNRVKFAPPNVNTLVGWRGLLAASKGLDEAGDKVELPMEECSADKKLRDRFMSLFYWPAVMSNISPDERSDVFDLTEEDEVVAASEILDASEIIEEAKNRASVNPKIVRTTERRLKRVQKQEISVVPTELVIEPSEPSTSSQGEEPRIPTFTVPPPIKKRILYAHAGKLNKTGD